MEWYVLPAGVTVGYGYTCCQYSIPPAAWHIHQTTVCTTGCDSSLCIKSTIQSVEFIIIIILIQTYRTMKCCYNLYFYCLIFNKVGCKLNLVTSKVFCLVWIFGACTKLESKTISLIMSSACLSVRPPAQKNSSAIG